MIEHEQYYRKGGTYELPIEIYNDLIGQIEDAQKERDEYKQLYENGLKVNQNTEKYRTELETKYVILQQENESNINRIHELEQEIDSEYIQKEDYKSRYEKAIKYIKSTVFYGMRSGKTLLQKYLYKLINILNGSDEK